MLPHLQFEGKMAVINSKDALRSALRELHAEKVVGFDTEARPSFRKGEYHPTSLIQISNDTKCFLIRVLKTGMIDELVDFLQSEEILKIGIAIHDDIIDLQRNRNFKPGGFRDLNVIAGQMGMEHIGAKNLSGIFLKGRISKNQQTSNWENPELTEAQQYYAATDAWLCLKVYEEIQYLRPDVLEKV